MSEFFKITSSKGDVFPSMKFDGMHVDSRTGEWCKDAEVIEEITEAEFVAMCEAAGVVD